MNVILCTVHTMSLKFGTTGEDAETPCVERICSSHAWYSTIDTEVQVRCPFSNRKENVARGDALRASMK